ncbi:hypothetical protein FACS1894151_05820 [Spirochaetia bacterium]|nr:hypothetical protein FACS1894151_05820 [Spirochaetia bacterium]
MKKKKNTKLKLKTGKPKTGKSKTVGVILNIAITLVCLAGAFYFLYLFWQDLNSTLTRLNGSPVALVTAKDKTVQRRFADRVVWDQLKRDAPIYNGDLIRTSDLALLSIAFINGDSIDLGENSMVQIFYGTEGARLDFSGGSITIHSAEEGPGMTVVSGTSTVQVSGGALISTTGAADADGNGAGNNGISLQTSTGSATITTASGARQELTAGQVMNVRDNGAVEADSRIVLLSPPSGQVIQSSTDVSLPVTFSWNGGADGADGNLWLEISADRNFNRIPLSIPIENNALSVSSSVSSYTTQVPPGSYWWRVVPIESNPGGVTANRLTILYFAPPELLAPASGAEYQYRQRLPEVRFTWDNPARGTAVNTWFLEVAANEAMQNPVIARQVSGRYFSSSELEEGSWYWRVKPVYTDTGSANIIDGSASAIHSFSVVRNSGVLGAPSLISPADGGMFNMENGVFSWRTEENARQYNLEIATDQDFTLPLAVIQQNSGIYRFNRQETPIEEDRYYWRVWYTDSEGSRSPASEARVFYASAGDIRVEMLEPPDNFTVVETAPGALFFSWTSNREGQERLQIAGDPDFSATIYDEINQGTTASLSKFPAGIYYWRVQKTGPGGSVINSAVRRFSITATLPVPAIVAPAGRILPGPSGSDLLFEWKANDISRAADGYNVSIYRGNDRQSALALEPVYQAAVESTETGSYSVSFPQSSFSNGRWFWTVVAFRSAKNGIQAAEGTFVVGEFSLQPLAPVVLETPSEGAAIPGLTALRNPVVLRWSSAEQFRESRLVVSRTADPLNAASGQIVLGRANPASSVSLSQLSAGTYYWTVEGITADGHAVTASRPASFRVLPIPALAAPANLRPAPGTLLGVEELRKSRTLVFSWGIVSEANGYIFSLYRESTDSTPLIRTNPLRMTSYTIQDLAEIGAGSFIWRVEAVNTGASGAIDQSGTVAEGNFTVNIGQPERPRLLETGTLYGSNQ